MNTTSKARARAASAPEPPTETAVVPRYALGDFLMKLGSVVEISDVQVHAEKGAIYAVDLWDERGDDPTAPLRLGGSVFWCAESAFSPIADPVLRLRVELTKATKAHAQAVVAAANAEASIGMLRTALQIMTGTKPAEGAAP